MIASDCSGSEAVPVTVKVAVAVCTLKSGLVHIAVICVVPVPVAVASPLVELVQGAAAPGVQMVATPALEELHEIPLTPATGVVLDTFCCRPEVPLVPSAINCAVWPTTATESVLGVIESAMIGSAIEPPLPQLLVQGDTVTAASWPTEPPNPGAVAPTEVLPTPTARNSPEQIPFTGTAQFGACVVVTCVRMLVPQPQVTWDVMSWFG